MFILRAPGRPGQPPQFVDRPSEHRTEIKQVRGKSVKLKCRASGKPNPKITWHRNDRKLGRSQQQHLTRKGWTLAFDNLLMTDAGKYTCRVKNRFGTISRIFYVRVAREYQLFVLTFQSTEVTSVLHKIFVVVFKSVGKFQTKSKMAASQRVTVIPKLSSSLQMFRLEIHAKQSIVAIHCFFPQISK